MQTEGGGGAYSSRHQAPSYFEHVYVLLFEANFYSELVVIFSDYALRASLCTFLSCILHLDTDNHVLLLIKNIFDCFFQTLSNIVNPLSKAISIVKNNNREKARNIDRLARVIFPVLFLMFNIGYWTFYTLWEPVKQRA